MPETIWLAGSEDVSRAASTMSSAAREMQGAASTISYALERHERFLSDWLDRYEAARSQNTPDSRGDG